jgi:DNA topoisomerase-1
MKKIHRKKRASTYLYFFDDGTSVKDKKILNYIKSLVIPPAYDDVIIFYEKDPKILFTGVDSKKRLQRIYSAKWRISQDKHKFCDLLIFSSVVDRLIRDTENIDPASNSMSNILLTIIRLIMACHFRIGNKKYKELYDSYGAINIQKRHVKQSSDGKKMKIEFTGKKGVINTCNLSDQSLIALISRLIDKKTSAQTVFEYISQEGSVKTVRAVDFNKYLDKYDKRLTSKMFRTWDSNMLFIQFMQGLGNPTKFTVSERKKNLVAVYKYVSDKINNTPAILKKSYTQGGLGDIYLNHPKKYFTTFGTGNPKKLFTEFLKSIC